jgi:hypothetical protein
MQQKQQEQKEEAVVGANSRKIKAAMEDHDKYLHGDPESKDYIPFINALDRIVAYPRFPDFKPSKIELMVKEVRDRIEAEYKPRYEEYERVLAIKKQNISDACAAAANNNNHDGDIIIKEEAAANKKARR